MLVLGAFSEFDNVTGSGWLYLMNVVTAGVQTNDVGYLSMRVVAQASQRKKLPCGAYSI